MGPNGLVDEGRVRPSPTGVRAGNIRICNFAKTFGPRTVLDSVSFDLPIGQVVGLLGQNGSGKSTLIKLLSGYHQPDRAADAHVEVDGHRHELPLAAGGGPRVAAVHQDLALVPDISVTENLLIGDLGRYGLGRVSWPALHATAARRLAAVGAGDIDPRALVGDLRPVQRALVALARAVSTLGEGGILILDEVTAFLPADGVQEFFALIRTLCQRDIAVLFVSHRMEEIRAICQRVVVLHNGRLVADSPLAETTEDRLIEQIVGQSLDWLYPDKAPTATVTAVRARDVTGPGLQPTSFEAAAGEIVGLTGLKGMGHDRLAYVLYGEGPGRGGSLEVEGTVLDLARVSPRQAMAAGVRLVPSERLKNGAVGHASVRENITLPIVGTFVRRGRLRRQAEHAWAVQTILSYGVSPPDPDHAYGALSGGNQQKVLIARWLETRPRLLLLDEPTQGVDVGARREIFTRIVEAAGQGVTVLYCSTETQDLAELCHRVLVFRDGSIAAELTGAEVTEANISRTSWSSGGTPA